jgi:hypothetical protein
MKLDLEDERRRAQAREVQLEHDATQKKLAEELETTRKKLQEVRSDPMQWQLTKKSQVTHLSAGVPVRVARAVDHAVCASVLGEWCSQLLDRPVRSWRCAPSTLAICRKCPMRSRRGFC